MSIQEFLALLADHPDHGLQLLLPDGGEVPAHYHITEVGHASKTFLDCGGRPHSEEACRFQVWIADDFDHRLEAGKLLKIVEQARELLPDLSIPVEFEHECPVLTQLTVGDHEVNDSVISLKLLLKKTDCLAKDVCMPDFSLPPLPGQDACVPGSGCC